MWRRVCKGREYVCWKEGGKQRRQLTNRWIWEQANGPIPIGHEIHHEDENPLNNDISNLRCVTAEWHDNHHQRKREHHRVIDGIECRRCGGCREYRPLGEFYIRRAGTYQGNCKDCQRAKVWEWKQLHRDRTCEQRRASYHRRKQNQA
jgi:hypothetical protein